MTAVERDRSIEAKMRALRVDGQVNDWDDRSLNDKSTDAIKYTGTSPSCTVHSFRQAPTPDFAAATVPVLAPLFALDAFTRRGAGQDQGLRPEAARRFAR